MIVTHGTDPYLMHKKFLVKIKSVCSTKLVIPNGSILRLNERIIMILLKIIN
jgi:hypothetical protein